MNIKPKYVRIASDLHLEGHVGQREEFLAMSFVPPDPRDAESILLLAGDISSKPAQLVPFLGWLKDRFLKVIYVPGNHEFYGHDMEDWSRAIWKSLGAFPEGEAEIEFPGSGVGLYEYDGLRIIATTLWGDGGETIKEAGDIGNCLRDFYVVKISGKRYTVEDMKAIHRQQKEQLEQLLMKPFDGKTIVVTHHMPSYSLCHPRFGSEINGGFASHCDHLLGGEHAPDLWVHGHTHDTIDKMLHQTRIICHPLGYVREWDTQYNQYRAAPKFAAIETLNHLDPVKPAI